MVDLERRCFVISPFGDKGSKKKDDQKTWEIATAVKTLIIDAAAERINRAGDVKLICYRGDEDPGSSEITKAIFESIYKDHLIIAVLFKPNDNVAYEIGLAHAISRPIIILKHTKYKSPFDVQGHHHVNFNDTMLGQDQSAREEVVANLCNRMRHHLDATGMLSFSRNPFSTDGAPFGRCLPFDRFRISYEEWSKLFQDAEQEIWLSGNTLEQLFYKAQFEWPNIDAPGKKEQVTLANILTTLLLDGRNVNILVMDEDNLALQWKLLRFRQDRLENAAAMRREKLRARVSDTEMLVRNEIIKSVIRNPQLGRRLRGTLKFTKVQRGVIKHRVTMSERRAYITPIFYSLEVNSGPAFDVYPKSANEQIKDNEYSKISLYKVVRDDLVLLQQVNPTLVLSADGSVIDGIRDAQDGASQAE